MPAIASIKRVRANISSVASANKVAATIGGARSTAGDQLTLAVAVGDDIDSVDHFDWAQIARRDQLPPTLDRLLNVHR